MAILQYQQIKDNAQTPVVATIAETDEFIVLTKDGEGADKLVRIKRSDFVSVVSGANSIPGILTSISDLEQADIDIQALIDTANNLRAEAEDRLDSAIAQKQALIDDAEARILVAEAQLAQAVLDLDSAEVTLANQATLISNAEARLDIAEADVAQAQADLTTAKGRLDGVDTLIATAQTDITTAEGRLDTAETLIASQGASISVNETEIALRATKTEVNQQISEVLDALTPAVRFQFLNTSEGFTATNATLTNNATHLNVDPTGAGAYIEKTGLTIDADNNGIVNIRTKRIAGTGWGVEFEFTTNGSTWHTVATTEPNDPDIYNVLRLDLSSNVNWTGTVTGIRINFGAGSGDDFDLDVFEIGKASPEGLAYADLESRVTVSEADIVVNATAITQRVTQTDFDLAEGRITDAEAEIIINANSITSKVSQTDFDTLEGTVNTQATTITQTANSINLLAYNLDVVAQGAETGIVENQASIEVNAGEIALKASQSELDTVEGRVTDAEASIIVNAGEIALKVAQTDFDTVEGRVTDAEASIVTNAGQIALKASQTDLNTIDGRVTDAEASIIVNAGAIALRVTQTDFDILSGTVSSQGTSITANADAIALKAEQSEVDTIDGRVTSSEASIIVNADAIATKVAQTDFDTLAGTVTDNVTEIQQTSTNIKLLAYELDVNTQGAEKGIQENKASITINADSIALKVSQADFDVVEGRVTNAEASIVVNANSIALKVDQTDFDTLSGTVTSQGTSISANATAIALKAESSTVSAIDGRVTTAEADILVNAGAIALRVTQTDFDTLAGTVSTQGTSITANASAIALKADSTTVSAIDGRVTDAEAEILVNAGAIALRVTQTDFDTLAGTVSTQGTSITANANAIALKVEQADFDTLSGTVSTQGTSITANANAITLKADSSTVSTLSGTVSSNTASIGVNATAIATKVSQTDYDTLLTDAGGIVERVGVTETEIVQTKNSINLLAYELDIVGQGAEEQVKSNEASITINAEQIALRVTQTDFDTLSGTVSSQGTSITANANAIALKADSTTVSAIDGRVTSAEASIMVNADAIALKAESSTVSAIDGRLSTAETAISLTTNNIQLLAYELDVVGQGAEQRLTENRASIEINANAIVSKVGNDEVYSKLTQNMEGFEFLANQMKSSNFNGTITDGELISPGTLGWAFDKDGNFSARGGWIGGFKLINGVLTSDWDDAIVGDYYDKYRIYLSPSATDSKVIRITSQVYENVDGGTPFGSETDLFYVDREGLTSVQKLEVAGFDVGVNGSSVDRFKSGDMEIVGGVNPKIRILDDGNEAVLIDDTTDILSDQDALATGSAIVSIPSTDGEELFSSTTKKYKTLTYTEGGILFANSTYIHVKSTTGSIGQIVLAIEVSDDGGSTWTEVDRTTGVGNIPNSVGNHTVDLVKTIMYPMGSDYNAIRTAIWVQNVTPTSGYIFYRNIYGGINNLKSRINKNRVFSTFLSAGYAVNLFDRFNVDQRGEMYVEESGSDLYLRVKFYKNDGTYTIKTIADST